MRRNVTRTGLIRKFRHQRFSIKEWTNRLPEVPAFIIGNGPSLNDHNLSPIENFFSIGINRAFIRIDPTLLLWQDISLWNQEYHRLHNTQAIKIARDVADPKRLYYNFYLKSGLFKFDTTKTHVLYGSGSSGPLAVQLAVAMGCRPIILLGMDCKKDEQGRSDFYGNNPDHLPTVWKHCQRGLEFVKNECPVEIINCGASDLWPRQKLEDVVNRIDPKWAQGRQAYVRQILGS